MKKGIVDVQLMNRPAIRHGKMQHNMDSGGLDHWTKSILKIDARALMKALGDQTGLVLVNSAIGVPFDTKHLFTTNKIVNRLRWNKLPSSIANESITLSRHGSSPKRVFNGLRNACRLNK